jgi:hypothetical protein
MGHIFEGVFIDCSHDLFKMQLYVRFIVENILGRDSLQQLLDNFHNYNYTQANINYKAEIKLIQISMNW